MDDNELTLAREERDNKTFRWFLRGTALLIVFGTLTAMACNGMLAVEISGTSSRIRIGTFDSQSK